jgi:hypothetical protein
LIEAMKRLLFSLVVAATCLAGGVATAHHSFAATYLPDQTVTVRGEVLQVVFRNPHSFVRLLVHSDTGAPVRYAVEWVGAAQLGGDGVKQGSLKPGDFVVVSGNPGRNPADHTLRMSSLFRPKDGFSWMARVGELPN